MGGLSPWRRSLAGVCRSRSHERHENTKGTKKTATQHAKDHNAEDVVESEGRHAARSESFTGRGRTVDARDDWLLHRRASRTWARPARANLLSRDCHRAQSCGN